MADEHDQPSGFKVVDRRGFGADGSRLRSEPESSERAPEARREPAVSQVSQAAPEAMQEFETLVSYLSTTAMYQLGLLPGPEGERMPPDAVNARRTIDLLEVLQKKTRGNLTPEEARLLDEVLYELHTSYLEVEKRFVTRHR
jgi:hypothetical protein